MEIFFNDKELIKLLKKLENVKEVKEIVEDSLDAALVITQEYIIRNHWFQNRTSKAATSIYKTVEGLVGEIFTPTSGPNSVEYAEYLVYGTGIYGPKGEEIKPKNADYLAFEGSGGETVYRKSVKGFKGEDYFAKGEKKTRSKWKKEFEELTAKKLGEYLGNNS